MNIQPSTLQILTFLRTFQQDGWNEKSIDSAMEKPPYFGDRMNTFLYRYCIENGWITIKDRGRFYDSRVSNMGEGLLMAGDSRLKCIKLWIEDHPSAYAAGCGLLGYSAPLLHTFLERLIHTL